MLGTMFANPTEFVLVVNSDNFIDGDGYKDAIIGAKEIAKKGVIAAVGVKPEYQAKNLGYIKRDGQYLKLGYITTEKGYVIVKIQERKQ